ncbi:biotin-dependent carboxyltransferase family protein [Pseudoalteromonas sp. Of7M-16]|uniref:5-oxoprolinase subunit C family protein n=1 Tax=Pseudoalteromonas sp. Of7M-16 TaxID=2917756 RepID=UPI001EF5D6CF|nr:biotin-dependent carboxyltransferase family protein [Pseudoalteromonas sp. Of7M-16]MCG7550103.1 biotin-dependent carboxyltransferase family protein [Pseudoalteromonas sp. Of7M-16]
MLTILKSGIQTCIQDLGRSGFRHLGVSQAGVIDTLAAKSANILLNNSPDTAVIEITVGLCKFKFDRPTNFSITGAELGAKLNGKSVATGWRYYAEANDTLTFASSKNGLRAYFAVQGGFNEVTPVMNSLATDVQAGFGGLSGRALQDGDVLPYTQFDPLGSIGAALPDYVNTIRVIPGPHIDLLPKDNQQRLYNQQWQVQPNSNRMGLRVASDIDMSHNLSITSQAVSPGVIQLPPNGQPIVLLNDCQTTGGYPIIAHVIEADLRHLGQLHAGARCQFQIVNRQQAQQALDQQQQHLAQLKIAVLHHDKKNI